MITSQFGTIAMISLIVGVSFWLQKVKIFQTVGPALLAIIIGIVLSNIGVMPFLDDNGVYAVILEYAIPLSMAMMLLEVNIRDWFKLSREPLMAMLLAAICVAVIATIAGVLFADYVPEAWKVTGMFVGSYTGGSANLSAIGSGLNVSSETFGLANGADYAIGIPFMLLSVALPGICKNSKWFQKIWPYHLSKEELEGGEENDIMAAKTWGIYDLSALLAIGFALYWIANKLTAFFPESLSGALVIVFVTTLALILAQFKPVREIKGSTDLGLVISMFFFVVIGLNIDISALTEGAAGILVMCAFCIFGSFFAHAILCRLFKIKYEYVISAIAAAIANGSFAAVVVAGGGWKKLIPTALVLGAIGYAIGNYLGIGIAYFVKMLIGG